MIKLAVAAVATAAFHMLGRRLLVPSYYLTALAGWGALCFLFSFELAGRRRRVRNGIEEKTPMQMAWMAAGVLCVALAFWMLFRWF